jgi:hypothetical protein
MLKIFKVSLIYVISAVLILMPIDLYAQKSTTKYNLKELTMPSEVKNLAKPLGSIFYSPSVKDKVLIPVHIWGAIGKSGLHFVPIDTSLVNGISLAGGPTGTAKLNNVRLTRKDKDSRENFEFDLRDGGENEAFDMTLKPGDTIFIEQSTYLADRAYYTSLIGIVSTILGTILLFRQVKKR